VTTSTKEVAYRTYITATSMKDTVQWRSRCSNYVLSFADPRDSVTHKSIAKINYLYLQVKGTLFLYIDLLTTLLLEISCIQQLATGASLLASVWNSSSEYSSGIPLATGFRYKPGLKACTDASSCLIVSQTICLRNQVPWFDL
jgi:hypothetical protein